MTEQEASDKLERLCGSVDKAFRLSYLWRELQQSVGGDRHNVSSRRRDIVDEFARRAALNGYSTPAIKHYVAAIQGIHWTSQLKELQ